MELLRRRREEAKEDIVQGNYTLDTVEATALKHAEVIGGCGTLEQILSLDFEDLKYE